MNSRQVLRYLPVFYVNYKMLKLNYLLIRNVVVLRAEKGRNFETKGKGMYVKIKSIMLPQIHVTFSILTFYTQPNRQRKR